MSKPSNTNNPKAFPSVRLASRMITLILEATSPGATRNKKTNKKQLKPQRLKQAKTETQRNGNIT